MDNPNIVSPPEVNVKCIRGGFWKQPGKLVPAMKMFLSMCAALLALVACAEAQVSFSARVFFPTERPIDIMFLMPKGFCLTVDGEDTVRYTGCDSTATVR